MTAPLSQDVASDLLRDHPDVLDSITFYSPGAEPARRVAAVVLGPLASVVDLRDHLWETLAAADLPDLLVAVPELNRDPAGAVDTAPIEASLDQPGTCTFRPPATPTEQALAAVWREVLGRGRIGADDNFLDLGGDSMTAALLLDLTNERLRLELTLGDMLAAPSLAALAESIDGRA
jgi:fengycin family lipopeptide synthetase D